MNRRIEFFIAVFSLIIAISLFILIVFPAYTNDIYKNENTYNKIQSINLYDDISVNIISDTENIIKESVDIMFFNDSGKFMKVWYNISIPLSDTNRIHKMIKEDMLIYKLIKIQ